MKKKLVLFTLVFFILIVSLLIFVNARDCDDNVDCYNLVSQNPCPININQCFSPLLRPHTTCHDNLCKVICVDDSDCIQGLDMYHNNVETYELCIDNNCRKVMNPNTACYESSCMLTLEIPAPIIGGDYNEDGSVNCIDAIYMREDLSRNRGVFQSRVAVFSDMLGINSFIVSLFNNYNSFTPCTWPQFVD